MKGGREGGCEGEESGKMKVRREKMLDGQKEKNKMKHRNKKRKE